MPIVDVQCLLADGDAPFEHAAVQRLADALGEVFGSDPGGTWVRMRYLAERDYVENNRPIGDMRPTFVEVLERDAGGEDIRAERATALADAVASVLRRPRPNVHVIFAPAGAGRVAFGGELIRRGG